MLESFENLNNKTFKLKLNKSFLVFDCFLSFVTIICTISYYNNICLQGFYAFFTLFYSGQCLQHFLMIMIDRIDVQAYNLSIRRIIGFVGFMQTIYLFGCIIFWQKTPYHPFYCTACLHYHLPTAIGILFVFHMIINWLFFVTFVHKFVKRRYYLLAIGGYQVERRRQQMIQQIRRRNQIIQPVYYDYPLPTDQSNKYYKFNQIQTADLPQNFTCPICLTSKVNQNNIIITNCNHFFHRQCIEKWATVNPKCPDCRQQLQLLPQSGKDSKQLPPIQQQSNQS